MSSHRYRWVVVVGGLAAATAVYVAAIVKPEHEQELSTSEALSTASTPDEPVQELLGLSGSTDGCGASIDPVTAFDFVAGPRLWSEHAIQLQLKSTPRRQYSRASHIHGSDDVFESLMFLAGASAQEDSDGTGRLIEKNRYANVIRLLSLVIPAIELQSPEVWYALLALDSCFDDARIRRNRELWDAGRTAAPDVTLTKWLRLPDDRSELGRLCRLVYSESPSVFMVVAEKADVDRETFRGPLFALLESTQLASDLRTRAARVLRKLCDAEDFPFIWTMCGRETNLGVVQAMVELAGALDPRLFIDKSLQLAEDTDTERLVLYANVISDMLGTSSATIELFTPVAGVVSGSSVFGTLIVSKIDIVMVAQDDLSSETRRTVQSLIRAGLESLNPTTVRLALDLVACRTSIQPFEPELRRICVDSLEPDAREYAKRLLAR